MAEQKWYVCIDLKSFYASVECVARKLDPLTTNLVVADPTRTNKTICLAITPAMKALGIRNRCRVFEIPSNVKYIMAPPRMKRYMKVSADIYGVYLNYVSPEDIHVYSIDECFIDVTPYLELYNTDARGMAQMLIDAVLRKTHINATAGIGTNLFLAKVALDITAKHVSDGIGFLDEAEFKRTIWTHRPITDIWNIGPGIAKRLARYRVFDLKGVCEMDESILYKEFGVNAEYLIDHAHGVEPCTIQQIHDYVPEGSSMTNGQVLACDYTYDDALLVLKEMVDMLVLELVDKQMVADSISLMVGYQKKPSPQADPPSEREPVFVGEHGVRTAAGRYGEHVSSTRKLPERTASFKKLMAAFQALYEETVDPTRLIKRINIGFGRVMPEEFATLTLFDDVEADAKERRMQEAVLAVKDKFGKNALLRGISLAERATARERNEQVGGHHG